MIHYARWRESELQALGHARTHNKAALTGYQHGDRTMPWAIVSKYLKPRRWWPEQTAKEGGVV